MSNKTKCKLNVKSYLLYKKGCIKSLVRHIPLPLWNQLSIFVIAKAIKAIRIHIPIPIISVTATALAFCAGIDATGISDTTKQP